jgi:hypothetical protein
MSYKSQSLIIIVLHFSLSTNCKCRLTWTKMIWWRWGLITALACRRIHFARLFSMYEDHIFVFMFTLSTFFCINMLRTPLLSNLFKPLNFLMLHFCLYHFGTGRLLTASLVSGRLLFLTRYIKLKRLLIPAASPSALLFVLILFSSD